MSQERFDRIDSHLERIEARQTAADQWMTRADEWMARAEERMTRTDEWRARADERFERIDGRLDRLEHGQIDTNRRLADLGQHMRVLHEDMIERFKGLQEKDSPTRNEMRQALAEERERTDRPR